MLRKFRNMEICLQLSGSVCVTNDGIVALASGCPMLSVLDVSRQKKPSQAATYHATILIRLSCFFVELHLSQTEYCHFHILKRQTEKII